MESVTQHNAAAAVESAPESSVSADDESSTAPVSQEELRINLEGPVPPDADPDTEKYHDAETKPDARQRQTEESKTENRDQTKEAVEEDAAKVTNEKGGDDFWVKRKIK